MSLHRYDTEITELKTYFNTVIDWISSMFKDVAVKNRKGVFEYILGGCQDAKLLDIRVFEESTQKS